MKKGYQLIAPSELRALNSTIVHREFAVAVLSWLIPQLKAVLGDIVADVDIEVICVTYLGSYPSLGLHYKKENPVDVGPQVEAAINKLLSTGPLADFLAFALKSPVSWNEVLKAVMGDQYK